ncbi:hypothetical protein ACJX0J_016731, partial [Zea mays]
RVIAKQELILLMLSDEINMILSLQSPTGYREHNCWFISHEQQEVTYLLEHNERWMHEVVLILPWVCPKGEGSGYLMLSDTCLLDYLKLNTTGWFLLSSMM